MFKQNIFAESNSEKSKVWQNLILFQPFRILRKLLGSSWLSAERSSNSWLLEQIFFPIVTQDRGRKKACAKILTFDKHFS